MKVALVFLILLVSVFSKVRYDGFKVIRYTIRNETEFNSVNKLADELDLDVWAVNGVEGWMDVMFPRNALHRLADISLPQEVRIEDVQASLDESDLDQKLNADQQDFFANFHTYAEITAWVKQVVAGKGKVESIGQTYLKNEINAVTLFAGTNKKQIIIQCGIHAREWISPSSCCWIISELLKLSSHPLQWTIIPVLNVDGFLFTHSSDRLWRKNRQPNTGSSCIGTDMNRNYPFHFGGPGSSNNPCTETYRGPVGFSGPAVKNIETLFTKIGSSNLVSYFDIHAYGALWMSPWGYTSTLPADYSEMDRVMKLAVAAVQKVNGRPYTSGNINRVIYPASGGSNDWSYGQLGTVNSYAVEAYGTSFTPPASWIKPIGAEIYAGVLETANSI
jgi:hypothetical protein